MANHYSKLTAEQNALVAESKLFFIASAHAELESGPEGQGPVNLSPKGNVPLHIVNDQQVAYLDYHGSGNETARHVLSGGPVTVMVMSLSAEDAAIVRLYGEASVEPIESSPLAERLLAQCRDRKGLRQVVTISITHTQTSCGYGVPVYEYLDDRSTEQRGRRFKQ